MSKLVKSRSVYMIKGWRGYLPNVDVAFLQVVANLEFWTISLPLFC